MRMSPKQRRFNKLQRFSITSHCTGSSQSSLQSRNSFHLNQLMQQNCFTELYSNSTMIPAQYKVYQTSLFRKIGLYHFTPDNNSINFPAKQKQFTLKLTNAMNTSTELHTHQITFPAKQTYFMPKPTNATKLFNRAAHSLKKVSCKAETVCT